MAIDSDIITAAHIASKKLVGKSGSADVHEVVTKGGLHLIVKRADGKSKILGTGPHRAIARHIASKNDPNLNITQLSKSDELDPRVFASQLPEWIRITDMLRDRQ